MGNISKKLQNDNARIREKLKRIEEDTINEEYKKSKNLNRKSLRNKK